MMITTDKTDGEQNADPKSEVENGRYEEVQESVAICLPLLEKKKLPFSLPCSSREEKRALLSAN